MKFECGDSVVLLCDRSVLMATVIDYDERHEHWVILGSDNLRYEVPDWRLSKAGSND